MKFLTVALSLISTCILSAKPLYDSRISSTSELLDLYESGRMNRQEFVEALDQREKQKGHNVAKDLQAIFIDHITVRVPNVEATSKFYQDVFQMPLRRVVHEPEGELTHYLEVGDAFFGIQATPSNESPAFFDHFCFGLKNYDSLAIEKRLASYGYPLSGPRNNDTVRFVDQDGFHIQLCIEGYANIQMNVGSGAE